MSGIAYMCMVMKRCVEVVRFYSCLDIVTCFIFCSILSVFQAISVLGVSSASSLVMIILNNAFSSSVSVFFLPDHAAKACHHLLPDSNALTSF